MTELFTNVSKVAKDIAELSWKLASVQKNPLNAANFLDNVTNYYSNLLTEDEIEYLRFYFNMKLEMMKK
jgi:hypothetical protein